MKKAFGGLLMGLVIAFTSFSQTSYIEFTFTAKYYGQYVQPDSIRIENLTQGCDTVLFYPDTVLVLENTSGTFEQTDSMSEGFVIFPNFPNPYCESTEIRLYSAGTQDVDIFIMDMNGKNLSKLSMILDRGVHSFILSGGRTNVYLFNLMTDKILLSSQIICMGSNVPDKCLLTYNGHVPIGYCYKNNMHAQQFIFALEDSLRFTCYAYTPEGIIGSDLITTKLFQSQTHQFNVTEGLPCASNPLFSYEGQAYSTVQIGTQCWMKENLNIGTKINSGQDQINNGIIEKYCHNNNESLCDIYGGLYQWDEMMQYTTIAGVQGICPVGWHIPTVEELIILIDYVGGLSGGGSLKETGTTHWLQPNAGATNSSGFSGLPGGFRHNSGIFPEFGYYGYWLSSTEQLSWNARLIQLYFHDASVHIIDLPKEFGYSVRCVKDL